MGVPLLALVVFVASPLKVQSDSVWSVPVALSLLREGDVDLDEYAATVERTGHYAVVEAGGHLYPLFPLGASLAAVPLLAAFEAALWVVEPLGRWVPALRKGIERWRERSGATGDVRLDFFDTAELLVASVLTSLAVLLVYQAARRRAPVVPAAVVALVFALGTSAYSTASRVLWQHSPSLVAVSAVALLLSTHRRTRGGALALGVVAGVAYVVRPTNSLTVLAVGCFLLATRRWRELPFYVLGGALVALPFCAWSQETFGTLLPPYYQPGRLTPGESHVAEALLGNLVSPGRGLFVYSPVALLACGALLVRGARRALAAHEWVFAGVLVAHWGVVSTFPHWWAGHSFGPRFFTDVAPYWVLFLVEPVRAALAPARRARPGTAALALSVLLSVAIHTRGSTARAAWGWNDGPPDVDAAPARLWDWSDLAFLRTRGPGAR